MIFIWTCILTLINWSSLDWIEWTLIGYVFWLWLIDHHLTETLARNDYFHFHNCSFLISLIGTSATAMTGSTLFVLPMVMESMYWRKRSRRCFRAILFVASIATRTIVGSVLTKDTPNIFTMMPKNTVRVIDMLSVKNGTVLIMVVDTLVDIDWEPCWENRT